MFSTDTPFRHLADSLAQLVWTVDSTGRVSYGNSAWYAFTAIGAGARFIDSYLPAIHPGDRHCWMRIWEHAISAGEPYALERRILAGPDGDYICQLEWGNPVRNHGVRTGEWIITASDVNENERLIAGLRARMDAKDRFLALLAHEMRGPLAPLSNALHVLHQHASEPAVISRSCAILTRQLSQMVRLVDDLFELAQAENPQILLRRACVNLETAVAAAVETAQPVIAARGQQLTVAVPPQPTAVVGDSGRLTQVFTNLLINATKYTQEGGRIGVFVELEADWALVRVRDSGVGIPRDLLARVFDAYVRAPAGQDHGKGGLGLGLTLARQLVELHGGTVNAYSEGPGRGSEFVVRLPVAAGQPHAAIGRAEEIFGSTPAP
jgi:signal transduction histidine kinase